MKLGQAVKIAYKNIVSNKLRAFLTMLGIIIGVSAVIALVSLGQGASQSVSDDVSSLGTTMVSVNIQGNSTTEEVVDYDEVMAFEEYSEVEAVSPTVSGSGTVKNGTTSKDSVSISGVTPAYEDVQMTTISSGRFILDIDQENRNKVVVLGSNVATELFGFTSSVGNEVKIDGTTFKVVGVLSEQGEELQGSVDDMVLIPFTTAQRFLGQTVINSVDVKMASEETVEIGMEKIERFLYNQFSGDETSYNVRNQSDIAEALTSVTDTMTLLLAGIAGISLIVGGIGIMNIMLVSVTERTREIGIRKAIGAKKKDILTQFLIEATVLSGLGGLLGVLIGIGSAEALSIILDMAVSISWLAVGVAVSFSIVIGVAFGIFPANKAANLSPLEALRH
ncbi:ABC transporter permease [Metabacillus sediminilitoris]|uniref:FtsX-like permease family protein n=1 Tax=Metabacillus sediminilitoris TaxID=2567941 RepID=A0A4S4BPK2_9BACI|nr:ABC transporter permease [Metabacillus sediminilitoris]QGQ47735.1 FtsX-like permease family protein [Metabacillus sediminilitoris]THF76840.1 FtsX-like permease family protein [Metabacillus sediminilitoris]